MLLILSAAVILALTGCSQEMVRQLGTEEGEVYVSAVGWLRKEAKLVYLDFERDDYQVVSWI